MHVKRDVKLVKLKEKKRWVTWRSMERAMLWIDLKKKKKKKKVTESRYQRSYLIVKMEVDKTPRRKEW